MRLGAQTASGTINCAAGATAAALLTVPSEMVDFPAAQTCCGQPHFNSGYRGDARDLARHLIQTFAGEQKVVAELTNGTPFTAE